MIQLIIGYGQLGTALGNIIGNVDYLDLNGETKQDWYDIIHICFPYSDTFEMDVRAYLSKYRPAVCIIHSTVAPGTTQRLDSHGCFIAYSPVRGRHGDAGEMERDMLEFTKFIGATRRESAVHAAVVLTEVGFTVCITETPEELELGKVFQTTMTGMLIAIAQEMARYCEALGVDYFDAMRMCEMPNTPPVVHQPGFIGGHCIIPNLRFLDTIRSKGLLPTLIRTSNKDKESDRLEAGERLWPIPFRQNR